MFCRKFGWPSMKVLQIKVGGRKLFVFELRSTADFLNTCTHSSPNRWIIASEQAFYCIESFFHSPQRSVGLKSKFPFASLSKSIGSCRSTLQIRYIRKKFQWTSEQLCLVPVRRLSRPSRSMHFGDVSETNGLETPQKLSRTTWPETHRPGIIMRPRD